MKTLRLVAFVAFAACVGSCTPAQWARFQQISTEVANIVSDYDGTVNAVLLAVQAASGDNAVVGVIRELVIDAEAAVLAEAATVDAQHTPLDTPAEVAAAFAVSLTKWDTIVAQLNADGMPIGSGSSAPLMARASSGTPVDLSRLQELRVPRLVRTARGM